MGRRLTALLLILSVIMSFNTGHAKKIRSISSKEVSPIKKVEGKVIQQPKTHPSMAIKPRPRIQKAMPNLKRAEKVKDKSVKEKQKAPAKTSDTLSTGKFEPTALDETSPTLASKEVRESNPAPISTVQKVSQALNPLLTSPGVTLEECDDTGEWAATYANISFDTSNFISGSGSIEMACQIPSGGNYCAIETSGDFDLSDMENLEVNLNIPDVSQIYAIGLVFYGDDMSSYYANYIGDYELYNGWNKIIRLRSDFYKYGSSVKYENIKTFRIFIFTNNGSNPRINIDRIAYNIKGKSKVLFTFEDGFYDVKTKAYPIMSAYGFKGTAYVIKNMVEYGDLDSLDTYDLSGLYSSGWDIGNHTESHPDNLNALTRGEKEKEFLNCQNWLISKGWIRGAKHASYSMGYFDDDLGNTLDSVGIKTAKADTYGIQNIPAEDLHRIKCLPLGMNIPVQYIKEELDRASQIGSTVVLMAHKVEDNPKLDYEISTANFQEIVDYVNQIKNRGLTEVVTISEWYNLYTTGDKGSSSEPPIPIPTPPAQPFLPIISKIDPNPGTPLLISAGETLDECDSVTEWNSSRRAKVELDTNNSISGSASIKITSIVPDGGNNFILEKHGAIFSGMQNMNNVEFNLYVPDKSQIDSIAMVFYSDDTHCNYLVNYIGSYELVNGWNKIRRLKSDFVQVGSEATWNKITCLRVNIFAKAGCWPSINIDRIAMNTKGDARLLFTYDDSWYDVKSVAYPIMASKGFKGTLWASKDLAEQGFDGYEHFMNVDELNEMYSYGWDIGNHTLSHPDDINLLTNEQKKRQYLLNQNWLLSNGWTRAAHHVCYPQGSYDDNLIKILQDIGVKTARTTEYGIQPVAVDNIYKLKCIPIGKNISVSLVKKEIDRAIETGSSIMFMLHMVEDNPQEVFAVSPEDFSEIVEYVDMYSRAGKIKVNTISEWYDAYMGNEASQTN